MAVEVVGAIGWNEAARWGATAVFAFGAAWAGRGLIGQLYGLIQKVEESVKAVEKTLTTQNSRIAQAEEEIVTFYRSPPYLPRHEAEARFDAVDRGLTEIREIVHRGLNGLTVAGEMNKALLDDLNERRAEKGLPAV
jgi:hypothetical protein